MSSSDNSTLLVVGNQAIYIVRLGGLHRTVRLGAVARSAAAAAAATALQITPKCVVLSGQLQQLVQEQQ